MAILHPFLWKVFKYETTSFHYFPPKHSESLKVLDIGLREVWAKRCLNGSSKVNTHTDKHMGKLTYRKHQTRGPMLWKKLMIHKTSCQSDPRGVVLSDISFRSETLLNCEQAKISSVWILWCLFRLLAWERTLSHSEQVNVFSIWVLWCFVSSVE